MADESVVPYVHSGGGSVSGTGPRVFADVVAADLDWVRAEFDAIVAANFADSHARTPRRHHPRPAREHPRRPAAPVPTAVPTARQPGDLARTARRVGARERSPPWPAWDMALRPLCRR